MNIFHNDNKKGQFNQVVILLLILASAIVILLFITKFVSKSTMDESVTACRLSVMTQSATAWGVVSKTSPLDINCDKRYINFYNTRAELGLSLENMNPISINYGDRKSKKFTELNEFVVDQVVAEELRVCKFQFGDGRIELFPNNNAGLVTSRTVCFVCSEITFEPTVPKQSFDNLIEYTKKTTFTEQGTSYFNYLAEQTVFDNTMWMQAKYYNDDPTYKFKFDTSKKYVIYAARNINRGAKDEMILNIIPADELNQKCALQAS